MKKIIFVLIFLPFFGFGQAVLDKWHYSKSGVKASYWYNSASMGPPNYVFTVSSVNADVKQVCYDQNYFWIKSDGMTTLMGQYLNPGSPTAQNYTYRFRLVPTVTGVKTTSPLIGSIGMLVNGVPIYGLSSAAFWNGTNNSSQGTGTWNVEVYKAEGFVLDATLGAHPQQQGAYHSHAKPQRLYTSTGTTMHSPLVGYAFDGFPVYGPYGYANPTVVGTVTRMKTGYSLRNITTRTTLPNGTVLPSNNYGPAVNATYPIGTYVEDYEWLASNGGDLDKYNGRYCVTPEYPNGTYAYFVTIDAAGTPQFPYYIGTQYYGVPETDDITFGATITVPGRARCLTNYAKPILTISATNFAKTYGDSNPIFAGNINGSIGVFTVVGAYQSNASLMSNVGNYTIRPSVTGVYATVYDVVTIQGVLSITKANLNVSANNATKTQGAVNPTFTSTITGLKGSDVVTVTYFTSATTASGVGNYPINPIVSGAVLSNYNLYTFAGVLNVTNGGFTVLYVSVNNATKAYGQANPTFTSSVSGLQNGDIIDINYSTTATSLSGVGNYEVRPVVSGAALVNYSVQTTAGVLNISQANLSISVGNTSKIYGQPNPVFSSSVSGLVNSDNISVGYSTLATSVSGVGNYEVRPLVSGAALVNYSVQTTAGVLNISQANLSISVGNTSKIYGQPNPVFSSSVSGLVNSDNISVGYSTLATSVSGVGNYEVRPVVSGAALVNYSVQTTTGVLNISQANLTVAANNFTRVYNTDNPVFASNTFGLIGSDAVQINHISLANKTSNAGTYVILPSVSGVGLINYHLKTLAGILTITKAPQTIAGFDPFEQVTLPGTTSLTLMASASSGLVVNYSVSGNGFIANNILSILGVGTMQITAYQPGNENYDFVSQTQLLSVVREMPQQNSVTGIASIESGENSLVLFPNPAKEQFTVKLPVASSIKIFNVYGDVVYISGHLSDEYVVTSLEPGIYFVKTDKQTRKIVVE